MSISRREFSQLLAYAGAARAVAARADVPLPVASDARKALSGPSDRRRLTSFDYKSVTLDGGPLRRQYEEIRDYYLRIPNDDLLKGFRARAGLPAPGVELGGWYSRDFFNIFGQILSGLSRMYAATGDVDCRDKVGALIAEWARTIAPDGFFYYTSEPNAYLYTYDKMVGGLVDAAVYGGNREALGHLSRITDWAIKNLNRGRPYSFNSPYDRPTGGTEWYTLTENLYRAYLVTGDSKYRDFGGYWEYKEFWGLFAEKRDIFSPFGDKPFKTYHAYSHVNSLSGAGAAYLLTGESHYLDTLKNSYEYVFNRDSFATGGFGPNERLMPPENNPATLLRLGFHFETQCGTWAVFKLGKYLVSFTGNAKYGDWVERVLINGIGASIPMSPDGSVFYYSDYNIDGGSKLNHNAWSCCAGTRPIDAADFHDILYFYDPNGLFISQFAESSVTWQHKDATVKISQRTRFPEEASTELHLTLDRPAAFELNVRIPGWLSSPMKLELNGKPIEFQSREQWATVSRNWRDGDVLAVTLPSGFWLAPAPGAERMPAAVMRGPVTMAFRSPNGNPSAQVDLQNLDRNFQPVPGEPLTYHIAGAEDLLMRPFYDYKEGERYYMYLDSQLDEWKRPMEVTATPAAAGTPWFSSTNHPDAIIEYHFDGSRIRWSGFRFQDGGKAEVLIDGKSVDIVDQYGPALLPANPPVGPALPFEWSRTGLLPGPHTLRIRTLEEKNEASKGYRITVARMDNASGA